MTTIIFIQPDGQQQSVDVTAGQSVMQAAAVRSFLADAHV